MQIQLEVISVGAPQTIPTKNGKSYQAIEVAYKKDGKIEGKKIMSFTNPAVFKAVQSFSQGDFITVTTEKNEAGYWQWEGVSKGDATSTTTAAPLQSAAATGGGTTKSTGTSWETKEERAAKQIMIVRQSSISSAVALANAIGDKKSSPDSIIRVAQEFETYVMDTSPPAAKSAVDDLMDMDDDIPM